jgi:hypothetical protein
VAVHTESTNGEIQTCNSKSFDTNQDKSCILAVYLTMSVNQIKWCGMVSEYLTGNVKEEEVVARTYYPSIFLVGLKTKEKKNTCLDSLCDGRDSNRVQTGALLLEQSCW